MLVYNVTVAIDPSVEEEWLQWMMMVHVPNVMATGCFTENKIMRILEVGQDEGNSYAFQYITKSQTILDEYLTQLAPKLRLEVEEKFGGKFAAFRTTLEIVG